MVFTWGKICYYVMSLEATRNPLLPDMVYDDDVWFVTGNYFFLFIYFLSHTSKGIHLLFLFLVFFRFDTLYFDLSFNLFFILIFTLILLIIIVYFRPFRVIDFSFWFHPSIFNWLGILLRNFFYLLCFQSNDSGYKFKKLMQVDISW